MSFLDVSFLDMGGKLLDKPRFPSLGPARRRESS